MGITIRGTGKFVPEKILTNADLEKMVDYIKTCNSEYGELNSWRVLVRNNKEKMSGAHTADSGQSEYYFNAPNIPRGICTNRTRVNIPDQDDNVYNLRNYHLISGPNDEFIDFYILLLSN